MSFKLLTAPFSQPALEVSYFTWGIRQALENESSKTEPMSMFRKTKFEYTIMISTNMTRGDAATADKLEMSIQKEEN